MERVHVNHFDHYMLKRNNATHYFALYVPNLAKLHFLRVWRGSGTIKKEKKIVSAGLLR
jgi:hypothetical protein